MPSASSVLFVPAVHHILCKSLQRLTIDTKKDLAIFLQCATDQNWRVDSCYGLMRPEFPELVPWWRHQPWALSLLIGPFAVTTLDGESWIRILEETLDPNHGLRWRVKAWGLGAVYTWDKSNKTCWSNILNLYNFRHERRKQRLKRGRTWRNSSKGTSFMFTRIDWTCLILSKIQEAHIGRSEDSRRVIQWLKTRGTYW